MKPDKSIKLDDSILPSQAEQISDAIARAMAIAAEKRAALLVDKKEQDDLKAASASTSSRPMLTSEALLNTVLNL